ncbi:transmembrane protein 6/97 [Gongronella butleri]|nr:transmembrane protein 6/97 [Gongronella butleri]
MTSLLQRPLDLVYFIYFATHIPVTVLIDFQVFYPAHWVPQVLKDALLMFANDYKDPFMGSSEPVYWYLSFIYAEALFQFAFFFVACKGLWQVVYGAHVATTVWPTLFEVLLNPVHALSQQERFTLVGFYLPYFILPLIMLIDSYRRVSKALAAKHKEE